MSFLPSRSNICKNKGPSFEEGSKLDITMSISSGVLTRSTKVCRRSEFKIVGMILLVIVYRACDIRGR